MYTVRVSSTFSAAHFIHGTERCENVHGHNYRVEVAISARELTPPGMVVDFVEIRKKLDSILPDHRSLNECYDFNPTAENLARHFYEEMNRRRTVRHFSSRPVPRSIVEWAVAAAGTAPSGAHKQPWKFVLVGDPERKAAIREAAENEERENYERRMPAEWLADLAPFGTDWRKPFLTICPWLLVVFAETYGHDATGKSKHYYVNESVGIATGWRTQARICSIR